MMRTNIRITELMTRLTALERERAEIIAEIETLQSAPSEQTAAIKVIPSEKAGDLVAPSGRDFRLLGKGQATQIIRGLGCLAARCKECPFVGLQKFDPVGDVPALRTSPSKPNSAHRKAAPNSAISSSAA